jgi:simple sugar transport system ATP-binding protein
MTPADAMGHGVGMVHQEFMLLPGFTITENVKLNRERTRPNLLSRVVGTVSRPTGDHLASLDHPAMRRDTRAALDRIGMSFDEGLPVGGLPVGHMQFVEIAREVDKENARVVVFDEPTAVLTETEADELLRTMKVLAEAGIAILFITHRLDEVLRVADQVTVLRDGERVGQLPRAEISVEELARLMIGRELVPRADAARSHVADAPPVLVLDDLTVHMPGESVRGLSLEVRQGEILGLAGLAGQGKVGVANGVMGLYPATGRVTLEGSSLPLFSPRTALERGLAFVSEDRRQVGLLLDESISRNVTATAVAVQQRFLRGRGPLALHDAALSRRHTLRMIEELDIRCQGPDEPVRRLSGGNQQKVCLARAVTLEPRLLFVSEPTRGIDVGAKDLVLRLLVEMNRARGTTLVITSSELAELRRVADRIAVVDGGRVVGILPPDADDVEFGLLFGGGG